MLLRLFFCCALFCIVTPAVHSEETEPEKAVTVEQLIEKALANSPGLRASRESETAAQERVGATRSLPNPTFSAAAGFTGSDEARDEEMLVSQPLDLFGKRRSQGRAADANLRRAEALTTVTQRALIAAVKQAAAELLAAQENEKLARENLELATKFRDAAARRVELGDAAPIQTERAQIELLRAENDLVQATARRNEELTVLNGLLGEKSDSALTVTWAFPDVFARKPSQTREELVENALKRPELRAGEAEQDGRRARIDVLRKERLPQVEVQVRRDSVWSGESSTALRAAVSVPIFDFGSIKKERRALQAEVRAGDAQLALERAQARLRVEKALTRLQGKVDVVERYRFGIVPQTAELLRKMQIGYEKGASSYLEVLEAQRTLRQVQSEYLQALHDTRSASLELENATGVAVPLSPGEPQ